MGVAVSSSHDVYAAPSSSGRGLLTLCPCSSVGSLPQETVLHELSQHESFPRGAVLHQLLPGGVLSLHGSTGPGRNLLQHGLHTGSLPPSDIHLLWCGVLHALQVEICSSVDLHGLQGDHLPHHGLLHRLQRKNTCSGAWRTSLPPSSVTLVSAELFLLHVFTPLFWLPCTDGVFFPS